MQYGLSMDMLFEQIQAVSLDKNRVYFLLRKNNMQFDS